MKLSGRFIVIDGPDGAGKSTQVERLRQWVAALGGEPVYAKDPGGTEIGNRIRHILLGYDLARMDARCEALLFMASRAQLVAEVIRPALAAGRTVVCDRFISSTCAYQVAAGMEAETVIQLGRIAVGQTWPDLTVVLDLPPELGFSRTGRTPQRAARRARGDQSDQLDMFGDTRLDAMERRSLEFHRSVRANFLALPAFYPGRVEIVDATADPDAVFAGVEDAVRRAFS